MVGNHMDPAQTGGVFTVDANMITTVVSVLVAVGTLVAYLERRLGQVESSVGTRIDQVEARIQHVDDRVFDLAKSMNPALTKSDTAN